MPQPIPYQLLNLPAEVASEIGTVRKHLRKLNASGATVFLFGLLGKEKLGTAEVEEFIMEKYLVYLKHELSIY